MKDNYEHIHWATNARLAEMLRDYSRHEVSDKRVTLEEAALRLEAIDKTPKFNNKQFE